MYPPQPGSACILGSATTHTPNAPTYPASRAHASSAGHTAFPHSSPTLPLPVNVAFACSLLLSRVASLPCLCTAVRHALCRAAARTAPPAEVIFARSRPVPPPFSGPPLSIHTLVSQVCLRPHVREWPPHDTGSPLHLCTPPRPPRLCAPPLVPNWSDHCSLNAPAPPLSPSFFGGRRTPPLVLPPLP